ncbi:hypothetical protein QL285_072989 [Trifolium repens]|nr:hypothetical protein QL285_072989 [Trifolium repens]
MEIVNSKSEEEDDENECDGDEGSVYDLDSFTLLLLFPISSLFFSTTSYIAAYATLCIYYGMVLCLNLVRLLNSTIYNP